MKSLLHELDREAQQKEVEPFPKCDEERNFTINYQFHRATPETIRDNVCELPLPTITKSFTESPPSPSSPFQVQYRYHRTREWLETAQISLHDRLQPGFAKSQRSFSLGSLDINLFFEFMMQYRGIAKLGVSNRRSFKDGSVTSVPHIFFQFNIFDGFPPLLDSTWHYKERSELFEPGTPFERWDHVKSLYTKVTFFINTDNNKIECHFASECFRLINTTTQEWLATF